MCEILGKYEDARFFLWDFQQAKYWRHPHMNPAELIRRDSEPLPPSFDGPDIAFGRRRNGALPGLVPSRDSSSDTDGSNESMPGLVLSRDSSSGTEGSNGSLPGFGDSSSERGSNGSLPDLVDSSAPSTSSLLTIPSSGSLIIISPALIHASGTRAPPAAGYLRPQDPHIDYPVPAGKFEGEAGVSGESSPCAHAWHFKWSIFLNHAGPPSTVFHNLLEQNSEPAAEEGGASSSERFVALPPRDSDRAIDDVIARRYWRDMRLTVMYGCPRCCLINVTESEESD